MSSRNDPTQANALKRLGSFLRNKAASVIRTEVYDSNDQSVVTLAATIEPVPERLSPLGMDDLEGYRRNAKIADDFVAKFSGFGLADHWTLDQLDAAFSAWADAEDKLGYSKEAVIAVVGAAFGHYCIDNLEMEWAQVDDADGNAHAVIGKHADIRAFPFHMVAKRIHDNETGFLASVYLVLQNQFKSGDYAERGA